VGASTPALALIPFPASNPPDTKPGVLELSHNDDVTIVEEHVSRTCPPYVTPIPKVRQDALATLPPVVVDVDDMRATFTRSFLASELGGSIQPLIVKYVACFQFLRSPHISISQGFSESDQNFTET
jgi:hypothetical protein